MASKQLIQFHIYIQAVLRMLFFAVLKPSSLFEHSPALVVATFGPQSIYAGRVCASLTGARQFHSSRSSSRCERSICRETILILNRGIGESAERLERLKRAREEGFDAVCLDETADARHSTQPSATTSRESRIAM